MATRIVPLNVVKLSRLLECRLRPVQVTHPLVDVRVSRADVANVALEVLHVDGVEADQRDVPKKKSWRVSFFPHCVGKGCARKLAVECPLR